MSTQEKDQEQPDPIHLSDEQLALHRHRYRAARQVGLSMRDAKLFALEPSMDIGEMRDLARRGCPPELMLLIL